MHLDASVAPFDASDFELRLRLSQSYTYRPHPPVHFPVIVYNMSRRAAVIEDEFDDDTDLPLPGTTSKNKQSLPNTGTRGALLEEISIEQEPTAGPEVPSRVRPSKPPQRAPAGGPSAAPGAGLMDPSDPMYQAFLRANAEAGGGRRPDTVLEGTPEMEKYKKCVSI